LDNETRSLAARANPGLARSLDDGRLEDQLALLPKGPLCVHHDIVTLARRWSRGCTLCGIDANGETERLALA
jgi:hypothetical protein